MKLSARMIDNVSGVNAFDYASTVKFTEGDAPVIYFQLIDASKDRADAGFVPSGRRYMPPATTTLSVVFDHIDAARKITRAATQPYATDPSIWQVVLTTDDELRGTVNMKLTLTEPTRVLVGGLSAALSVDALDGMTRI